MDYAKWGENNSPFIYKCLDTENYYELFKKFHADSQFSSIKGAAFFNISRRSYGRYLTGKRKVPMAIVHIILKKAKINYSIPERENLNEFDENGRFIWYGNEDVLFNTLFAYRTIRFKWSRFEAACKLNIQEDILLQYENGTKKISIPDQKVIMEIYKITIQELYPTLLSYDGGRTYLPLKPLYEINIDNKIFDLYEEEFYIGKKENISVLTWPEFPMYRYSSNISPLYKCMQDELTLDEYINTDSLILYKDDLTFPERDLSQYKLPPVYEYMIKEPEKKHGSLIPIKKKKDIKFLDGYKIVIYGSTYGFGNEFDLHNYVFSDSILYQMLQDPVYFISGKLSYIGEKIPQNQCIIWECGQYIRIIELYIEKYPNRNYGEKKCITNNNYYLWTEYTR